MKATTGIVRAVFVMSVMAGPASALAAWPDDQPITIIVPQAAGGTNDTAARMIGVELGKALGQTVVVENRPGASGAIGMGAAAKSKPDGYTLAIASDSATVLSATRENLPWRLERDMVGVAKIGEQPIVVGVSAHAPYRSLADMLTAAREAPGKLSFGSSGVGTNQHIIGEWLASLAGVSMIHVPYKGGGQAVTDLIGGTVPAAVLGFAPLYGPHRNGTVRVVAVSTPERDPALPDVPTLKELGYDEISLAQWVGLVAPKDTPPEIVARISKAVTVIVRTPEITKRLSDAGLTARPVDTKEFDPMLKQEIQRWGELTKRLKLELN